jgi:ubiquinone/menaquinone biosynthesis C-methylase UbiE
MNYRWANRSFYNYYGESFGKDKGGDYYRFVKDYLDKDVELFLNCLNNLNGKLVLDLGSGPGRDSLFFKSIGLVPVCLDISSSMARSCRAKGLSAVIGELEYLPFSSSIFNGVWAYASLLHIPKNSIHCALDEIYRVLLPKGILFLGMKEGDYEGYIPNQLVPNYCKFMAHYSDEELRCLLGEKFDILHFSRTKVDEYNTYLNYLASSKSG